jgi:Phytanoyl-CoA dioxygenase (PhyH)
MIKKWALALDKLLNRGQYLSVSNRGIDILKDRNPDAPSHTQNMDDASLDSVAIADRNQRYAAALERLSDAGRADWPPVYPDPFPGLTGAVPEICAADLTVDVLGGAVAHHGVLLIRGLFNAEQVAATREVQDRVKAASLLGTPDSNERAWYMPFDGKSRLEKALRSRAESRGGNWLADSPLGLARVMQILESIGVVGLINEHFQERSAISLQKSTLRSVQPEPADTGWHQDGSFLDDDVRSMNVWVALSPCGGSFPASGIELIPRRFEEILPVDTSLGVASISPGLISEIKQRYTSLTPQFDAGDALMFDEHFVHRTSLKPGISEVRYALECWFFAPSHCVSNYVPFLV